MAETTPTGSKLIPVLVILLVVASFLIGSLYTRVNLLEKGTGSVGAVAQGTGNQPVAPAQPPSTPVDVDITGAPVKGSQSAKVALVEFTDYECPFCGQLFTTTYPSIKKEYIDTGKIKYIVKDYPLTQIHPQAQKAAEAANCAEEQGKFWEMHDKLFANQKALLVDNLKSYAAELGLNTSQFNSCLDSGKMTAKVTQSATDGAKYGVRGTPASFVGIVEGNTVKQATEISGAQPFASFQAAIDGLL